MTSPPLHDLALRGSHCQMQNTHTEATLETENTPARPGRASPTCLVSGPRRSAELVLQPKESNSPKPTYIRCQSPFLRGKGAAAVLQS